ncbi:MAG: IclR family transcriptional regulator [Spirochaetales bacterium]|nr:IclR family transcriptional regulator [Spirochaetales bacterium]
MPSIGKIYSIMELLREHSRFGLSNKEISETLDIPQSTCYRILSSLKKYDFVYQRKTDMRYFLGFVHLRFAQSLLEVSDEATVCLPFLDDLHTLTGETVFYAKYSGNYCVAMEIRGSVNTRIAVGQGEVMPMHCSAAGKAVLAFIPRKEREKLYNSFHFQRYTNGTIADIDALEEDLKKIYQTGVSYNHGEFHEGINAMATPIFDRRGRVSGSIALVGTAVSLSEEKMSRFSRNFIETSLGITERVGGRFPEWLVPGKE